VVSCSSLVSDNPYIKILIDDYPVHAMVDSGSQLSLIPYNMICPTDLKPSKQIVIAANGSKISIEGEVLLPCKLGDFEFEVRCLVSKQLDDFILGLSWLKGVGATWDFGARQIWIKDKPYSVDRLPRPTSCRRISISRDKEIPPSTGYKRIRRHLPDNPPRFRKSRFLSFMKCW
jgi:hypothetical protein